MQITSNALKSVLKVDYYYYFVVVTTPSAIHVTIREFDQFCMRFMNLSIPETTPGPSLTLNAFLGSLAMFV